MLPPMGIVKQRCFARTNKREWCNWTQSDVSTCASGWLLFGMRVTCSVGKRELWLKANERQGSRPVLSADSQLRTQCTQVLTASLRGCAWGPLVVVVQVLVVEVERLLVVQGVQFVETQHCQDLEESVAAF
eukprot:1169759-Amphidinium_carterae.2